MPKGPLVILPDRFGDAKNKELDKAVNEAMGDDPLSSTHDYRCLFNEILHRSKEDLDQKYRTRKEFEELLNVHEDLRDMLSSSWERKSYSDIRNLEILVPPRSVRRSSDEVWAFQTLNQVLSSTFKGKYHGVAVDAFYEYLTYNEKLFREGRHYAMFCSIVQSSGTGKSRMLTELGKKDTIAIYMNIRDRDDTLSFPPRDGIPSDILTAGFPSDERSYAAYCYAFFVALFRTVEEHLSTSHASRNAKASIMSWVEEMCDMSDPPESSARAIFFQTLRLNYRKAESDFYRIVNEQPKETRSVKDKVTDFASLAEPLVKLFIRGQSPMGEPRLIPRPPLSRLLQDAFLNMTASLERVFPEHSTRPKLVIAFDEAHTLSPQSYRGSLRYRPADVVCKIVNEYSHIGRKDHGVWVVFASTTSRAVDILPPDLYDSTCVCRNVFPTFTQLGWDQVAPPLGAVDVENVSQLEYIASLGRPLWLTLKSAFLPTDVLETSSQKLYRAIRYNPLETNQVLAVLGQRFAINFTFGHPDSIGLLESAVARHLRVCHSITLDHTWRCSSYPSEPLLSHAAAASLHGTDQSLQESLKVLLNLVDSGTINMGQDGELAGRLLWLLAKDLFVRTRKSAPTWSPLRWNTHIIDCQMISVIDWLEFIFGPQIWDVENPQGPLARKMFENAYLNFSHWIHMEDYVPDQVEQLPLNVWSLRHWYKTSAIQCDRLQPCVDKVIPIYFKAEGGSGSAKERMSQILISERARAPMDSKDALSNITRAHANIGGEEVDSDSGSLPYIAILAELGQKTSSFYATYPEQDTEDRCLRIHAAGVDTTVYPFLSNHLVLMTALQQLAHRPKLPETEGFYSQYLYAQMMFGSTATTQHMEWEHGSNVP